MAEAEAVEAAVVVVAEEAEGLVVEISTQGTSGGHPRRQIKFVGKEGSLTRTAINTRGRTSAGGTLRITWRFTSLPWRTTLLS